MRSEKGEFLKQSGGLFGKEGKPCKRGLPLSLFRYTATFRKKKMPATPFSMELQAFFKGALSLAERPSLAEQSPGLFGNSLPAERTAYS